MKNGKIKLALAFFVTVVLLVSVMMITALADGTASDQETLEAAIAAASTDGVENVITVTDNFEITSAITIGGGRNITLTTESDGGEGWLVKTITASGVTGASTNDSLFILADSGSTLSFKGGIVIDGNGTHKSGDSSVRIAYVPTGTALNL